LAETRPVILGAVNSNNFRMTKQRNTPASSQIAYISRY